MNNIIMDHDDEYHAAMRMHVDLMGHDEDDDFGDENDDDDEDDVSLDEEEFDYEERMTLH